MRRSTVSTAASAPAARAGRRSPRATPTCARPTTSASSFVDWLAGIALVYGVLLSVGEFLFGTVRAGAIYLVVAALAGAWLWRALSKVTAEPETDPS